MAETLKCITPVDGSVYVERPLAGETEIAEALARARAAQAAWRHTPLAERQACLTKAVDAFIARKAEIAEEIAWQMGRPVGQCPGEVAGFEERARHMIAIAPSALGDIAVAPKDGFTRPRIPSSSAGFCSLSASCRAIFPARTTRRRCC